MSSTERQPVDATLEILLPLTSLHYSTYGVLGFTWRGDPFDYALLAFSLLTAAPRLWRDGQALHHNCVVRPREIRWARERQARRARRAAAHAYLGRNHNAR